MYNSLNTRLYTVPIKLGNTVAVVTLGQIISYPWVSSLWDSNIYSDTGSSDLWVVSNACRTNICENSAVNRYPSSSVVTAGKDISLFYGDSTSETFARGFIGRDSAAIAGWSMTDQTFGLINNTSNPILSYGISGIFGLGFPTGRSLHLLVLISFEGTQLLSTAESNLSY